MSCDGKSTCKNSDFCCGGAGTSDWIGAACKADCQGAYQLSCDDATDCTSGMVCCMTTDLGARAKRSYCAQTCPSGEGEAQLCSLDHSECPAGTECRALTMFSPEGLARCSPKNLDSGSD